MANNSQARKWLLVINNPQTYGFCHNVIKEKLMMFMPEYFCMSDEVATTGTLHTHIFIYSSSPIRFSTLKDRFPIAHIEKAYGSVRQNRDYVTKSGKWADTDKSETIVQGSFFEYGSIPSERAEKNPLQYQLIQDLNEGKRTAQIVEETPALVFKVKDIDTLRQTLLAEKYGNEYRQIEVTYLWGVSGAGKTRSIYSQYPVNEICRITNYRRGNGVYFDAYSGQDVLVFEEFYSQIPIEEMLNYLDVYPLLLPARYSDKVACYTKVFITSNIPLTEQYKNIQIHKPETWKALLRRICKVVEYQENGIIKEIDLRKGV